MMDKAALCVPIDVRLESSAYARQIEARRIKREQPPHWLIETMAHATTDTRQAHRVPWFSWLNTLAARERQRRALLDIRSLPDYLKLDIGYYEDNRRGPAR